MSKAVPAIRADEVLLACSRRHPEDLWLTEVKTGPTMAARAGELRRIDGLAVRKSWAKPCITGYEVKVSRADWLRDNKWHEGAADCHAFWLACPPDLIAAEELPDGTGLLWVAPGGRTSVRRKAVYRQIELPALLLYYIAISRTEHDRHPFFTSRRAALEAWVADKGARKQLGYAIPAGILAVQRRADEAVEAAERRASEAGEDAENWRKALPILQAAGVCRSFGMWGWEDQLRRALAGGPSPELVRAARDAEAVVHRVADLLGAAAMAAESAPGSGSKAEEAQR